MPGGLPRGGNLAPGSGSLGTVRFPPLTVIPWFFCVFFKVIEFSGQQKEIISSFRFSKEGRRRAEEEAEKKKEGRVQGEERPAEERQKDYTAEEQSLSGERERIFQALAFLAQAEAFVA